MAQPYVKDLLASQEAVLIETRQHWMAAIRFALRPILVGLIGVGLLALNSIFEFNDDQFFSFINDLITWAIVILFLITIVWLPIDLIRWDSRRFVLTNQRAMRVEGVLQKSSVDASLEQITDIGMHQSTFGRWLGYADLTLYTASDMSNEAYEQLMDGPQFKLAVLEAKNALRAGAPIDALPEGFVVKGGTNEASMRADGKIVADEEAEAAAPVQDEQPTVAPPPPAMEPAPQPVVEPEPVVATEPEPVPEPETVSAPEPVTEPALVVEPEPEPVEPEPVAEVEPEPEPVAEDLAAPAEEAPAEEAAPEAAWPAEDTPADDADAEPKKDDGPTAV